MEAERLRIDPAEAMARVMTGEAVILDVVSPQAWAKMDRAIAGAIRINPREIEGRYLELPRDKEIVAYCT